MTLHTPVSLQTEILILNKNSRNLLNDSLKPGLQYVNKINQQQTAYASVKEKFSKRFDLLSIMIIYVLYE